MDVFSRYFAAFLLLCDIATCLASEDLPKLKIEVTYKPEECERKTQNGDQLKMHYTGTLEKDGTKFDSSHERNAPFDFQIGSNHVIKGWDEGLLDMCVGEKRKLTVPPHLGYGDAGAGDSIPAESTLIFETELVSIEDGKPQNNVFKEIDVNDDKLLSQDEVSNFIKKQQAEEAPPQGGDGSPTPPQEGDGSDAPPQEGDGSDAPPPKETEEEHNNMISDIFNHEDKDKDGFISLEEFSGPKHDEL